MTATYNANNLAEGPALFKKAGTALGHTAGGIDFDFKPNIRMQVVDYWGKAGVNGINQGDDIKIKVPLAEWTAATLKASFGTGNDQTTGSTGAYMGMGRSAGYVLTAFAVQIVPILASEAAQLIQLQRAIPIGELKLPFTADKDRIFETELAGLIDETQVDGEMVGKIFLN